MGVNIPHFDIPFRFVNGNFAIVEQNSDEDVRNCVEAIVRTPLGTRPFVPEFGIDDLVFENQPIDLVALEDQISRNEPRARIQVDQQVSSRDELIDYVTVGYELQQ